VLAVLLLEAEVLGEVPTGPVEPGWQVLLGVPRRRLERLEVAEQCPVGSEECVAVSCL
jgi:hypothetical protein